MKIKFKHTHIMKKTELVIFVVGVLKMGNPRNFYCAIVVYAMPMCSSVCHMSVLLKRLNVVSHKQHHMIAQRFSFLIPRISTKLDWGQPLESTNCRWGGLKSATFDK